MKKQKSNYCQSWKQSGALPGKIASKNSGSWKQWFSKPNKT